MKQITKHVAISLKNKAFLERCPMNLSKILQNELDRLEGLIGDE